MGQYWMVVNLDRKEYVHPWKLGSGLKLVEQLWAKPGTGAALIVLCAAMGPKSAPASRGGGDMDVKDDNEKQPLVDEAGKAVDILNGAPKPETYEDIAKRTIGRWAGDRICLIGDYAEDADMPGYPNFGSVYKQCDNDKSPTPWTDVSDDVARIIEHECNGTFGGDSDGWRDWNPTPRDAAVAQ